MSTFFRPCCNLLALTALLAVGSACTAARTGIQLQQAVELRDNAEARDAREHAPYEFHMARYYLEKAWEEAGHGEHKASVQLARKSMEWADQALIQIGRGPTNLEPDLTDVEDAPAPAPRPLPTDDPATLPDPRPAPAPVSLEDEDDIEVEGL